jgi:hypothetical protein
MRNEMIELVQEIGISAHAVTSLMCRIEPELSESFRAHDVENGQANTIYPLAMICIACDCLEIHGFAGFCTHCA